MKKYYVTEGNLSMGAEVKILAVTDSFQEAWKIWKIDEIKREIVKKVEFETVERVEFFK